VRRQRACAAVQGNYRRRTSCWAVSTSNKVRPNTNIGAQTPGRKTRFQHCAKPSSCKPSPPEMSEPLIKATPAPRKEKNARARTIGTRNGPDSKMQASRTLSCIGPANNGGEDRLLAVSFSGPQARRLPKRFAIRQSTGLAGQGGGTRQCPVLSPRPEPARRLSCRLRSVR
jgi:hypothetical protein